MKGGNGDKMTKDIIVKESKINGKGVFASRDFNKDEFILRIDGEIVETDNPPLFRKKSKIIGFPLIKREKHTNTSSQHLLGSTLIIPAILMRE